MAGKRQMDRKDFLALTVTSVGAGAWLLACGSGDDDDTGTGGTGGTGQTAGKGGAGGSAGSTGSAGKGGTGPTGAGGTGPTGAGGTGPTGAGGTGPTGAGGTGAGGAGGTGAGGAGGTGAGGAAGSGTAGGGAGGGSGGTTSMSCVDFSFTQTDPPASSGMHDHIPAAGAARDTFFADLLAHINGPNATMPFTTPMEGPTPHSHTITFTQPEIDTLRGGGTVTKVKRRLPTGEQPSLPDDDTIQDTHTWEISCGD